MIAIEILGWSAAFALLAAYALLSTGRAAATGRTYVGLNLAGSTGLAANGAAHTAWPSMTLNLLWLAIAIRALKRLRRINPPACDRLPDGAACPVPDGPS